MAVGDGSSWDETTPTNATLATSIDDYMRDDRIGTRSRMQAEHEWPASQSATNQAGQHKFVTFQNQSAKPTVSGTQLGAVYSKTVGSGLQEMYWENEAGTEVQMTNRGNPMVPAGTPIQTIRIASAAVVATTGDALPIDNSIPQITEGFGVTALSTSITCLFTTSDVLAKGFVNISCRAGANFLGTALFVGTTANAIAANASNYQTADTPPLNIPFSAIVTSAGTSQINFSLRVGCSNSANGFVVNGMAGTNLFNGVMFSELLLQEIKR